jgi:hypothetical protein
MAKHLKMYKQCNSGKHETFIKLAAIFKLNNLGACLRFSRHQASMHCWKTANKNDKKTFCTADDISEVQI